MIKNKKILLGITGSIAAYKAAILVRMLVKSGAEVRVVMTPDAKNFVTPLTLSTLSKNPVLIDYFNPENGSWNNHVELGTWADLMVIAPCTAQTIHKMAHGVCDNLLTAVYLSARCPVLVAPAMDHEMYHHVVTQANIKLLKKNGCGIISPGYGSLASGIEGDGRMAEPEEIFLKIDTFFPTTPFSGKKILITAGPTFEPIDPVRYIGNHSSGKMGYALAEEAVKRGMEVYLVSGPVALNPPAGVDHFTKVRTAVEMYDACMEIFPKVDIAVFAAAVADFKPKTTYPEKFKKDGQELLSIELEKNPDILAACGAIKNHQWVIGFALETENEEYHALQKKKNKNADWIVLNSLKIPGSGFGTDTNQIVIFDENDRAHPFLLKSKRELAFDIFELLQNKFTDKQENKK